MKAFYIPLALLALAACSSPEKPFADEPASISYTITPMEGSLSASIRGMDTDTDDNLWMSGSSGKVYLLTVEDSLREISPEGYENLDFRSIACLNANTALIMSAGSPAVMLKTTDQGLSWQKVYEDTSETVFYNAIDFWNDNEGVAFGDPENRRFRVLMTTDGGDTWQKADSTAPYVMNEGEAGFAASGTNLRVSDQSHIYYLTGGSHSAMLFSADKGQNWLRFPLPIRQGKESEGGYSFDIADDGSIMVVGGDYTEKDNGVRSACISVDGGVTWSALDPGPNGYRSCVEHIEKEEWIAVGINGIDITDDNGQNWLRLDTNFNLNVVTFVRPAVGYAAGKNTLIKIERE